MQFLIDECLTPALARDAIDRGFLLSSHVVWRGLQGAADWQVCRYAMAHGFVLVTNNVMDFKKLYRRQATHPGLICLTLDRSEMSRPAQRRLFAAALDALAGEAGTGWRLDVTSAESTTPIIAWQFPDPSKG